MKLEGTWELTDHPDMQLRLRLGNQIAVFPIEAEHLKHWSAAQWMDVLEGRLLTLAAIDGCKHDWTEVSEQPALIHCAQCGVTQGKIGMR